MIISIDIGSTNTKAIAMHDRKVVHKINTRSADALTSVTWIFEKMLSKNSIHREDIRRIIFTGAGAGNLKDDIFDIPAAKADEIQSIGTGGMFLTRRDNIMVANVGTGTAIVDAQKERISHLGGSGVGGGTIMGLAKKLLFVSEFSEIIKLAERGNLKRVDLSIGDIMGSKLSFLKRENTASNFGKILDSAQNEDIALAILNMVYQVIGMLSVFAAKSKNARSVAVTGNASDNQIARHILENISTLYQIQFEYPENAEYTTAIGAALLGTFNEQGSA
jgi:type II pantothenate kinase